MSTRHIVSFSAGKDSTAMLLMMLEKGMQVDDIVFCNIMATPTVSGELPETYEYIKKVEDYIGREITFVQAKKSYEEYFYTTTKKGNHIGDIYAFPWVIGAWCNGRLKRDVLNKYHNQFKDHIAYVGIAADEPKRLERLLKKPNTKAPLAEWGVTEDMAKTYLEEKGLLNPLYEKYDRLGCWFCNKASLKSLRLLYKEHPEYWDMLRKWQVDSYRDFKPNATIFDLEKRFEAELKAGKEQ